MHFIDQFSFEIVHKPGKDMPSDLLSRPPDGYMETKHPLEVTDIDNENDEAPRITEDSDADNAELGPNELSAGMFYYYAIQTTDNTNGDVFYDSELISEATLEVTTSSKLLVTNLSWLASSGSPTDCFLTCRMGEIDYIFRRHCRASAD